MIDILKEKLYFVAAWYFRLCAQVKLKRWNPIVIVVTGSSGKTTLLHFLQSQLYSSAYFSHHANSALGIPFDILGIHRKTLKPDEWIGIFLSAPLKAFSAAPKEKIYVVEADCDRPYEGKFISTFLKPDITAWVSVSRTHSANFDYLVAEKKFETVEDAIAYEYGYFLENTKHAFINGDSPYMRNQKRRAKGEVVEVSESALQKYELTMSGTSFTINGNTYSFNELLPKEIASTIQMTKAITEQLKLPFDQTFSHLQLPTGRTSLYNGIKNTTIIDSSYNANLSSMTAILHMFEEIPSDTKWVVLGDMRELGTEEREEHEKLAILLSTMNLKQILLLGPVITNYTYKKLKELEVDKKCTIVAFTTHTEALTYIKQTITGGELILFKASQSLVFDSIIQHLLQNPNDIKKLPRREPFWDEYRKKRGL